MKFTMDEWMMNQDQDPAVAADGMMGCWDDGLLLFVLLSVSHA